MGSAFVILNLRRRKGEKKKLGVGEGIQLGSEEVGVKAFCLCYKKRGLCLQDKDPQLFRKYKYS